MVKRIMNESLRSGCSIKDEDSVVLIGGYDGTVDSRAVTRYDLTGLVETLPDLMTSRSGHTCTMYKVTSRDLDLQ